MDREAELDVSVGTVRSTASRALARPSGRCPSVATGAATAVAGLPTWTGLGRVSVPGRRLDPP